MENIKMTKEDVLGKFDQKTHTKINDGMIVSRRDDKCSIFKDIVESKSVTIICNIDEIDDVIYWIDLP